MSYEMNQDKFLDDDEFGRLIKLTNMFMKKEPRNCLLIQMAIFTGARKTEIMGAPSDGVSLNDVEVLFSAATGDWVGVTHIGIRDESAGGNLLLYKALPATVNILNTNNFRIPINNLEITFA